MLVLTLSTYLSIEVLSIIVAEIASFFSAQSVESLHVLEMFIIRTISSLSNFSSSGRDLVVDFASRLRWPPLTRLTNSSAQRLPFQI
jgi:hypothetical protein